ncbi:ATP-dependent sacrificial sulfur transferase LarE [Collinsella vaginalis]|uniref:ATP-dependent sacrificial sulfur transferase LarE n=1 Tax=Collinsella vaginalis TaxID=1870987 RepID=UPI000A269194|nr:ATP-dependent sacrificial sulfur transferase LarE [Collinsella vaginalis]
MSETNPDASDRAPVSLDVNDAVFQQKLADLESLLQSYGSIAIACSGGVDSSFLAAVCERCMPERTLLVHVRSTLVPAIERRGFANLRDRLSLEAIEIDEDAFDDPQVTENNPRRCYFCKFTEFGGIIEVARERGIETVIDGSNIEDEGDYRPGLKAISELGVRSPLREAGWTKAEERAWLRAWGFPAADQSSSACLASRIPYGEEITREKIELVAKCEAYLEELGFSVVRVRLSNMRAAIEVGVDERARLFDVKLLDQVDAAFRSFGCKDVLVRARGYAQGSMNSALSAEAIAAAKGGC